MSRFKADADRIKEDALYEAINVLVWGPGNPGPVTSAETRAAYEKRLQIKDVLKGKFPRAEVHFSEDPEMINVSQGIHGQLRREALQAAAADLILMLDNSRGADLELDHFVPTYSWFRDKVFVFLPEQYVPPKGLVAEVFDYLRPDQVEGYSKQEFDLCHVATIKAVNAAHSIALSSLLKRL